MPFNPPVPESFSSRFGLPQPRMAGSISSDPLMANPPGEALIPIVDVTNKATTVDEVRRSSAKTITQNAHGFVAGTALFNNNGTWTKAKADAIATARVDGVVSAQNLVAGSFVAVSGGDLMISGWAPNTQYYLSDATAGLLTTTPPTALTSFIVPVARGNTTTSATVQIGEPLSLAKIPDSALENPGGVGPPGPEGPPGAPGTGAVETGIVAMFPRTGIASGHLPLYWMECNGTNGTTDEADVGAMAVVIRHAGTVETPVFSVPAGSYGSAQTIGITCPTSSVEIRVTTDGSTPSRTVGALYTAPFVVAATATVKAIAYRVPTNPTLTMIDSAIASAVYTITGGGGGGGALYEDDFAWVATNGVLLDTNVNWTIQQGVMKGYNDSGVPTPHRGFYPAVDSADSCAYWDTGTPSENQRIEVTLGDSYNDCWIGAAARVQAGAVSYYSVLANHFISGSIVLAKTVAGTRTSLVSQIGAHTFAVGDKVALEVTGTGAATRLTVQKYVSGAWVNVSGMVAIDPTTYLGAGYGGVCRTQAPSRGIRAELGAIKAMVRRRCW